MTRNGPSSEQVRASLWFWPAVAACASFVLTVALLRVRPAADSRFAQLAWPGDTGSAQALLQTVATAAMTATSLTFSLTVVALQLASQQFSPRLLRSFARDGFVQTTMAVLISAVVVPLTALRGLERERPLPVLALLLVLVLGLASAGVLLAFLAHIARRLRVDSMMAAVHGDSVSSMRDAYPAHGDGPEAPGPDLPQPADGVLLTAWRSGFVRTVDPDAMVEVARRHDVLLLLGLRPGDSVVLGTPVATACSRSGHPVDVEALTADVRPTVVLGGERTEEQDVAFGLRQLVDIAVKAISPGVNDPTTAAEAVSYCADLVVRLQGRRLGPQLHRDADGVPRVVSPDRDLAYYVDLVCAQTRRYGRREPAVLAALLRLLRDAAVHARDDEQRRVVAEQKRLVVAETSQELLDVDREVVRDLAVRVDLALAGDVVGAYRDRAGETRSI